MGYQALLFCPDEKTARTVTQVLGELEFTVIPCTEPFAAVKKLMGEHFDAVVVDCDNEQNATLLFKSARNAPNNQSSLAVAVVEGQAGVAKAFRIGANLVLTKPINVEQAKGTLRVARGLLRKGEAAKPATPAANTAVKPAPVAPKPVLQVAVPNVVAARPAAPMAPLVAAATASILTQKPTMPPTVVASLPTEIIETGTESFEATSEEIASQPIATPAVQASAPKIVSTSQPLSSTGFGASAGSAPAPAREPKPGVSTEDKPSAVIPEPESVVEKVAEGASGSSAGSLVGSSAEETSAPAPSFTFGGNVSSDAKSAGGGSKKALLAVAAVVLIAAGGYEAWTQWNISGGSATVPSHVAVRPVVTPAAVPHIAPSAATVTPSSSPSSVASSSAPSSTTTAQQTGSAATASDTETVTEDAQPHQSKPGSGANSSKPAVSVVAANKTPATAEAEQPIIIKNGLSRPAAKTPAPTTDEPAPNITGIAAAGNGGMLPNLMGGESKAPTPVLQTMSVSQGVSRGLLVKSVQPSYPASALRMNIEGPVQLMATISKNGDISAVKILSGDASLAHSAADAVKQWKYKPYLLNGEPVEIQTQVTVIFKLPR